MVIPTDFAHLAFILKDPCGDKSVQTPPAISKTETIVIMFLV